MGFGETEYLEVPITTIVQPIEEMVETAWGFLLAEQEQEHTCSESRDQGQAGDPGDPPGAEPAGFHSFSHALLQCWPAPRLSSGQAGWSGSHLRTPLCRHFRGSGVYSQPYHGLRCVCLPVATTPPI